MRPCERRYVCARCGDIVEPDAVVWRCECGGTFVLEHADVQFAVGELARRSTTMWRYAEALPFAQESSAPARVTMGEGWTPLVDVDVDGRAVTAKVEYASPTLSFKDRGAVVLVAKALELGAGRLVADSSGNAGAAIAAYASRAGLPCEVFVARSTASGKLAGVAAVGAAIRLVDGDRDDVARAAIAEVEASGSFYASHVYNPFFLEGTKTFAFELWEQLGRAPDVVVLPAGNGTLVLGAYIGFSELHRARLIERLPRLLVVQAAGCAPVARAFHSHSMMVVPVVNEGTIADGIAIAEPARGDEIVDAVRLTRGTVLTVTDDEISAAANRLARQGLYVEPTAAVPAAGVHRARADGWLDDDALVVLPLGGAGPKV
ncbi:MAG: threonine synthase [Acidimicrobiales bacterium]